MRCPWCGNPATTHGDWWECYYCGDSGNLRGTPVQQPAQITLTLSFVYHVDLPETWSNLKKELNQIAPKNALLSQLLGKVLLHHNSFFPQAGQAFLILLLNCSNGSLFQAAEMLILRSETSYRLFRSKLHGTMVRSAPI